MKFSQFIALRVGNKVAHYDNVCGWNVNTVRSVERADSGEVIVLLTCGKSFHENDCNNLFLLPDVEETPTKEQMEVLDVTYGKIVQTINKQLTKWKMANLYDPRIIPAAVERLEQAKETGLKFDVTLSIDMLEK